MNNLSSNDYEKFLRNLKERIRNAQVRAALAVNKELVLLYWQVGKDILSRQQQAGWGAKIITQLAADLKRELPDIKGFSRSNLLYMRAFAQAFPDESIVQDVFGQITWYHNISLLEKLKDAEERVWYAKQTVVHGWSRNVLVHQIESGLYRRMEGAITNFDRALPQPQSDLAQQLIKDPYHFDFLSLSQDVQERELETALVEHIRDFLLELGVGFSFVGSQYRIEVDGDDYYIDLLFYHLKLRCFVVIDLKVKEFQPEFSGKMSFYISAVDDLLRHRDDNPTIGIILCKGKKKTAAEYALRDVNKPIGVSTYQLRNSLPESLRGSLPTPEQLEMELESILQGIEASPSEDSD
ncbi:PDDEXK nuclease domain-containing protein [Trichocoleus desertorum AS-A10]|uniref:PDDEXK nuclease domain-containing protein n=1 Tax=Trichocoleus desertorum TaxID=1481672 RepID=UPI003296B1BB